MSEQRTLGSTYRLQLAGIGFDGARRLVAYLSDLGIETLYVSPILAAAPGSTHGYDVIDPTRLDPELGTPAQFEKLLRELDAHDMRLLVDIVPNHMACLRENRWWWDVLRNGRASKFACTFDIDWSRHVGRVLVPTLAQPLAELLDSITYDGDGAERVMEIGGQAFPLAPGTRTGSDLAAVLARQHYQPSYWRLSSHEGNYRRFFDIDGLIGVRVEDEEVFERTHGFIATLGGDDRIAGWRVDHVDGLTDPGAYLARLASTTTGRLSEPVILVEKILGVDEQLPRKWSVDGTTGYEFANLVGGLFVDERGARRLASFGHKMTGDRRSFSELGLDAKREVILNSFDASLERLARLAKNALNETRPGHDVSWVDLRRALTELTAQLDVYRTYFSQDEDAPGDVARVERIKDLALDRLDGEARRAASLVAELLTSPTVALELTQRWQQFSSAVMAKGVEDTATYRYSGLLSHAEVGCDPDRASATPEAYHELARRHHRQPSSLNATSTHDSKRSEDARSRLFTLSEVPDEWIELVTLWQSTLEKSEVGPDVHDELLVYQSFVAVWPIGARRPGREVVRRVQEYAVKAAREAKRRTSWTDQDAAYERALVAFIASLAKDQVFCGEMAQFIDRIAPAAATNSLSMTVLKCVCPGTPDFYQGTELWDFSLTDPDNRRAVDFSRRSSLLDRLLHATTSPERRLSLSRQLLERWGTGALKLFVTKELLWLRREHAELFSRGTYHALASSGAGSSHVVSAARQRGDLWAIAVTPRQSLALAGPGHFPLGEATWGAMSLRLPANAPREYRDIFTGATLEASRGRLRVAQCLQELPVAVLVAD